MKKIITYLVSIFIIIACGAVFYHYVIYIPKHDKNIEQDINAIRNVISPESTTSTLPLADEESIIKRVDALMGFSGIETPTVATISDPSALQSQPFYLKAKVGYKVLIYTTSKKAVLYDPFKDEIVNVGPLNVTKQ